MRVNKKRKAIFIKHLIIICHITMTHAYDTAILLLVTFSLLFHSFQKGSFRLLTKIPLLSFLIWSPNAAK